MMEQDDLRPKDFTTMDQWQTLVKSCADFDALNQAAHLFKRIDSLGGRHIFNVIDPSTGKNKMGLARWWLNKRAEELNGYRVHDNTYRPYNSLTRS